MMPPIWSWRCGSVFRSHPRMAICAMPPSVSVSVCSAPPDQAQPALSLISAPAARGDTDDTKPASRNTAAIHKRSRLSPPPPRGGGPGWGDDAEDGSVVKKEPSPGARDRARTLRRAMTEAERRLWQMLRSRQNQGWRFRRQVPIGGFIADFACHEARLIVEIDGGQHDPSTEEETGRTRFLEGEGYRVLRFWNNEVLDNPEGVRSAITEHLQRDHPHAHSTGHPHPTLPHRGGGVRTPTQPSPGWGRTGDDEHPLPWIGEDRRRRASPPLEGGGPEPPSTPFPSMGEGRRRRASPPLDGERLEAPSTPSPSMGEGRGGGDDAENRRLREQLREALAREAAMAEVLQVINSSPGELPPIFDTILEKAHSLCGVAQGALLLREGEQFRLVALHAEPRVAEYWRQLGPLRSRPDDPVTQPMRDGQVLHFADVLADD